MCVCRREGNKTLFFFKVLDTAVRDHAEYPAYALLIVFSGVAQILHLARTAVTVLRNSHEDTFDQAKTSSKRSLPSCTVQI